jgi:hypothetical protein
MDVGVQSSNVIYDPIRQVGVPQNRRRKVVTLNMVPSDLKACVAYALFMRFPWVSSFRPREC